MKFVLCNDATYQELYEKDKHSYIRLEEHTDLAGYAKIEVLVHEEWYTGFNDERYDYLEQQLVALADFRYITLTYVDNEGIQDKHYPCTQEPLGSSQKHLFKEEDLGYRVEEKTSQGLTEELRMKMLEQEDGCASGACAI